MEKAKTGSSRKIQIKNGESERKKGGEHPTGKKGKETQRRRVKLEGNGRRENRTGPESLKERSKQGHPRPLKIDIERGKKRDATIGCRSV